MKTRAQLIERILQLEYVLLRFNRLGLEEGDLRLMMISMSAQPMTDANFQFTVEYGKVRELARDAMKGRQ